jgi:hypothetical protein
VTPQMTSDAASNGPQPFFSYPLTEDQLLGQHFFWDITPQAVRNKTACDTNTSQAVRIAWDIPGSFLTEPPVM